MKYKEIKFIKKDDGMYNISFASRDCFPLSRYPPGLPPCGNVDHLQIRIPKRPQDGSEPANLDNTEVIVTSEPNLKPPFIEVAEENYLDIFDEI